MIPAKEFEGELWIKASDHHQAIKEAQRQWIGLEPSDMPDGDDPMYDHDFFLKGMAWADAILRKKNVNPSAAPVQVSPTDFVDMVMDKEDAIGKPIFWAEWPNREKNHG